MCFARAQESEDEEPDEPPPPDAAPDSRAPVPADAPPTARAPHEQAVKNKAAELKAKLSLPRGASN